MNTNMNPKDDELAKLLEASAQAVNPNPAFIASLEHKLKTAHKPRARWSLPHSRSLFTVVGWAGALAALALIMSWAIRTLAPLPPQPAAGDTSTACPVTVPNGSMPPGESAASSDYLGNDQLWTVLWPEGRVLVTPQNRKPDGSYSMKWGWWRAVTGPLTIEGRRLDAESAPLRADIPEGYGDIGFQVSGLIFAEPGCWEVTGRVGNSSLTFVTEVVFVEAISTPNAVATSEAPVRPVGQAYDWNGTQLYLSASLPEVAEEYPLYQYQPSPRATLEEARTIAAQLGMNGPAYTIPAFVNGGNNDFLLVDGNQRLQVQSDQFFTYIPDYTRYTASFNPEVYPDAENFITDFLAQHGFDSRFQIDPTEIPGMFSAKPLTPDGLTIRSESFGTAGLSFQFSRLGLFSVSANLPRYTPLDDKTYRIIPAEEALQRLIDPAATGGTLASQTFVYQPAQSWTRQHPQNETITLWGYMSLYPSAEGGAPLVNLDGFIATGNVSDFPVGQINTFVEARGQFVSNDTNGTVFQVESWKVYTNNQDGLVGSLTREGDKVILTSDQEKFILPDVPSDVPLPMENIFAVGVKQGDTFEWTTLDTRLGMGGGGGGGGYGFYKLNLSGTPIAFPSSVPLPTVDPNGYPYTVIAGDTCSSIAAMFNVEVDKLIELNSLPADCSTLQIDQVITIPYTEAMPPQEVNLRGILSITLYEQADGNTRPNYGFLTMGPSDDFDTFYYYILEGEGLETLQEHNGMPVDVWGTLGAMDAGIVKLNVERFEFPFPDLQYEIRKGSEQTLEINGQSGILFTDENGNSFVELGQNCYDIRQSDQITGADPNDLILAEILPVPNLTLGGYPAICVFANVPAINPITKQPMELEVAANQISTLPEPTQSAITWLAIEKVELVYYMPDQRYMPEDPARGPIYLQPAWRFYGHFSDGSPFEALIQALAPTFLSPELDLYTPPG